MPKYLIKVNYTLDGVRGFVREGGSGRRAAVEQLIASVGGRMEAFYFALGETDVYVIAELPDNTTVAALGLAVAQSGKAVTQTTVLLTPEEVDAATKRTVDYRPPGG